MFTRRRILPLVLLTGCSFKGTGLDTTSDGRLPIDSSGSGSGSGSGAHDANPDGTNPPPVDAPRDAPTAATCYGTGVVHDICPSAPVQATLPSLDINTDTSCTQTYAQADGTSLCVVIAQNITLNGIDRVVPHGSRALVLVATDTLMIDGTLDVSSRRPQAGGAVAEVVGVGADSLACTGAGIGAGAAPGGGGAGGSFTVAGAGGGRGNTNSVAGGAAAAASAAPTTLRGGCRGGAGGGNATSGGHGGGAIYLIAGTAITINGTGNVLAVGEGGGAGNSKTGGGGGGTGGMIVFDAPTVTITGHVDANGGGGGEGGGSSSSGNSGGESIGPTAGGQAGFGATTSGGDGGNGGFQGTAAVAGHDGSQGGGGGGGAVGVVKVYQSNATFAAANVSPSPT